MYNLEYTGDALKDMQRLKRSEPQAFKKLSKLLYELMEHPETGTGHPEQLKGNLVGRWSRRIIDQISTLTVAQYINYLRNQPISRVKYALV